MTNKKIFRIFTVNDDFTETIMYLRLSKKDFYDKDFFDNEDEFDIDYYDKSYYVSRILKENVIKKFNLDRLSKIEIISAKKAKEIISEYEAYIVNLKNKIDYYAEFINILKNEIKY